MRVYMVRDKNYKDMAKIVSSKDVYNFAVEKLGMDKLDRESFFTLYMNAKQHVEDWEEVSRGSATGSIVHPREVFKGAILMNAVSIICIHNHPSGNSEPSREDVELTKRLWECGDLLGIKVLDHVIVGDGEYRSLLDMGLMK